MLRGICEYPYQLGVAFDQRRKTTIDLSSSNNSRAALKTTVPKRDRRLSPMAKRVVFKRNMVVGGQQYLIEIHKKVDKVVVFAYHVEAPNSFSLELSLEEAKRLTTQQQITESMEKMAQAIAPILSGIASLLSNSFVLYTTMGTLAAVYITKLLPAKIQDLVII